MIGRGWNFGLKPSLSGPKADCTPNVSYRAAEVRPDTAGRLKRKRLPQSVGAPVRLEVCMARLDSRKGHMGRRMHCAGPVRWQRWRPGISPSPVLNILVRDPGPHFTLIELARCNGQDGFLVYLEHTHQFLAACVRRFSEKPQGFD